MPSIKKPIKHEGPVEFSYPEDSFTLFHSNSYYYVLFFGGENLGNEVVVPIGKTYYKFRKISNISKFAIPVNLIPFFVYKPSVLNVYSPLEGLKLYIGVYVGN